MLRIVAVAAMFALALPVLAEAQAPPPPHPPRPPAHPVVRPPHGPPPPRMVRPGLGVPPMAQFNYRGHRINRIHLAPYVYPRGWAYRRWAIGAVLPPLFLTQAYFYADWAALGLAPPEPGFQWVRYGPDLLLVNVATGQVVDVIYGAFY
jgi:hypothetical protein